MVEQKLPKLQELAEICRFCCKPAKISHKEINSLAIGL
jgi:hypothetical protein